MTAEQINLVRELRGTDCACGARKVGGKSFCQRCYYKLPRKLQRDLYNALGSGYEEAYADSIKFLEDRR